MVDGEQIVGAAADLGLDPNMAQKGPVGQLDGIGLAGKDVLPNVLYGAHKGHGAAEHVDELAQLVQTAFADQFAHAGDAAIVAHGDLCADLVGILHHGAEFEDAELLSVLGHAHLSVEHRAGGIQLDGDGQQQKHRRQHHQHQRRHHHIKDALAGKAQGAALQRLVIGPYRLRLHRGRQVFPSNQFHWI